MTSHTPSLCPTLDQLSVDPSDVESVQPVELANKWIDAFRTSVAKDDTDAVVGLFHEHGFWKDILALTWDLRTIRGAPAIKHLLDHRLALTGLTAFKLFEDEIRAPALMKPLPGLVFIRFSFGFETKHGSGTAVAFLVPTSNGSWKAWSLLTKLDALKVCADKDAMLRDPFAHHDNWEDRRKREIDFEDRDPTVLIIGAGHSGLEVAARLRHLGVSALVIDRNARIGDNWRTRYKTLCLHDTICELVFDMFACPEVILEHRVQSDAIPGFSEDVASLLPSFKVGRLARMLCYASALDLNVWLSSSVTSATFKEETMTWHVAINRGGKTRTMVVNHLVFATGFGGGFPHIPDIPGKELYHGVVLHSTQFTSAIEHAFKKAIIIGACNSAHDIALDLYRHGADVTMIQRSPTYVISEKANAIALGDRFNDHFPIEFADILQLALPFSTLKHLLKGAVARIANTIDKDLLDGLAKAGFQTYLGPDGAGLVPLVFERGGGLYIDTGASKEIINGNIKVKNSPSVQRFTEKGVELEGGTLVEGDAVIFATGYGDIRNSVRQVCGPDVAAKVGHVWGLDAEGELQGVWRRTGFPRLWIAMGNLGRSRLHSLHLALQIKALEVGIVQDGEVYAQ